ncbi:response regulator transcription factor [Diplocloster modestus]|uniref:Stage 0 sporulation protein A homolog n=1 Tax=Diplocloster modestus TaxID=2850322 RepID=A0ABS6K4W5_9FIRM|nr:response regulator [Diplocloster modestus]MBU9725566.1 response regulator [Diplocloster modestus]
MKRWKVLLVDDEHMIREGFKKLFSWEEHDCEVVGEASDGVEAINQAALLKPDVVIMDINIPIINGLDVIRILKAKDPGIAFIVVSGYDDFHYCKEAIKLKIVDYIRKPVDYEEFGDVIDNLKIALYQEKTFCERQETDKIEREDKMIFEMTKYIQENLQEEITLKVLADKFYLSPVYVSQMFRNKMGVNFLSYLTHLRIEKSKILLMTSQKSIAEIAGSVGFKDYRVYSRVFKKLEKVPPSQYYRRLETSLEEERYKEAELAKHLRDTTER